MAPSHPRLKRRFRIAAEAARKAGFVHTMPRHAALFYRRSDRLVVSFDNLKSRDAPRPCFPWGYDFLEKEGYSHLGIVMQKRNDWFRHHALWDFFDALRAEQFFQNFRDVVFYGASMGGYGALAFCAAAPGSRVFTFSPQTTLDPRLAPFETRYPIPASRGTWSGRYGDGAEMAKSAAQVIVCVDPFEAIDMAHVARLPAHNLTVFRSPHFGHNPARMLKNMGLISTVTRRALAGELSAQIYTRMIRSRRGHAVGVARNILNKATKQGHARLAMRALDSIGKTRPVWNFPRIQQRARLAMSAGSDAH